MKVRAGARKVTWRTERIAVTTFTSKHPAINPTSQIKSPDCDVIDASCIATITPKNIFPVRVSRSTIQYRLKQLENTVVAANSTRCSGAGASDLPNRRHEQMNHAESNEVSHARTEERPGIATALDHVSDEDLKQGGANVTARSPETSHRRDRISRK